jgi:thiamine pyrophosphokinase
MNEVALVGPLGPALPDDLQDRHVIAVDGGARFVSRIDLWVGDGDSLGVPPPECPRFELPVEKEESDLAFALSRIPAGVALLHLWGFWGGRRDHEWFNLGEVNRWLRDRPDAQAWFYDDSGAVRARLLTRGNLEITGGFSMATLEAASLTLTGACQYAISKPMVLPPLSSRGLSNHGTGGVRIESDRPVVIFLHSD